MIVYVDSSAAAKLIVEEAESPALKARLDALVESGSRPYTSRLTETELRRLAVRAGLPQQAVTEVMARMRVMEPDRTVFRDAGLLPGEDLRSLDALHVAAALRLGSESLVTYDRRQIEAAEAVGLMVESPV